MKCSSVVKAIRSKTPVETASSNTAARCTFHISAKMHEGIAGGTGTWKFGNVSKVHTCRVDEAGRGRYINSRVLMATSDVLLNFVPGNRKSHGNTKQIQQMAKTIGFDLKPSQAFSIVKDRSHHTIEFHLVSYWFLQPIVNSLQAEDPLGTYILEDYEHNVSGVRIFQRYYIAPSHTKANFRGTLKMRVQDGTHVTSPFFAGIYLVCVTVDPNRQVKLLAFARVGSETKTNWLWFEELLQKDFPGTRYIHADYSKGVESNEFGVMLKNANIQYGRCFRHMMKNCNTAASKAGGAVIKNGMTT